MFLTTKLAVKQQRRQHGFTLTELLIVIAILGIIAAIAYPNYQRYAVATKRADMMAELQNIASRIETQRMAQGSYSNINTTPLTGNYPKSGTALYTVNVTTPLAAGWTLTATPISGGQMANDGVLTLDQQGQKCRETSCGTGDQWRQ